MYNRIICYLSAIVFLLLLSKITLAQTKEQMEAHRLKWNVPIPADTVKNPFSHNTAITDTGKALYIKGCSVCHGTGGRGDGVAAAGLAVKPADHTSNMVQAQTDGTLFYEITNGHAPMPGFKTVFTEKQRWALINYIRTLAKPQTDKTKSKNNSSSAPLVVKPNIR